MKSINSLIAFVLLLQSMLHHVSSFVTILPHRQVTTTTSSPSTSLNMIFGPKQALAMEKKKNPQQFERTIINLMKTKKLTREQAEDRYGAFLLDPEGFALRAAEEDRRASGLDWKEAAIARSSDPDATRKRIDEFQKKNSIKGTAIIIVFFTAVVVYNSLNPYVPPSAGL